MIASGGGRPIFGSFAGFEQWFVPFTSFGGGGGGRVIIVSTEEVETASGVDADDNDDDDDVRLSSAGRNRIEELAGDRCARYLDGWNDLRGKRTGREDFIQRLFDNWKRFIWNI